MTHKKWWPQGIPRPFSTSVERSVRDRENLSLLEFSKIPPDGFYSSLLRTPRKHNIRFSRNVFPQRDAYLSMHLGGLHLRMYNSHAGKSAKRDIAEWWKCVRLLRSGEFHGKSERKQSPESAAATKEVAKCTVRTAVTALCFDSNFPAALHFPPAGWLSVSPTETLSCRVFKFIYFPSLDIFYFLRLPWSRRSQLPRPREFQKSTARPTK